jgi:hypothetical protein
MAKIDNAKAEEILRKSLIATGDSELTVAHASDYEALGRLFTAIFSLMFPDADVTSKEGGAAILVCPHTKDEPTVSLGLTSTMERLKPNNLQHSRNVILEKIENSATVFETVFIPAIVKENQLSPSDRDIVFPIIMSRAIFEINETHSGGKSETGESPLVGWRIFDGVVGMMTLDRRSAFQHLFAEHLSILGLNRDEVRILAMRNLRKLYAREKYKFDYNQRLFEVGGMNGLASSLLLVDDFWEQQRRKLGDDVVIHLVSREHLVFFRKNDRELLANVIMALLAGQVPNLVEGLLFEFDGKIKRFSFEGSPKFH